MGLLLDEAHIFLFPSWFISPMPSYLLKGGTVATYTKENEAKVFKTDALIENSLISQVGEGVAAPDGVEVIDCTDRWITPGFVDAHRYGIFGEHVIFLG